jgi:hypothetical protein
MPFVGGSTSAVTDNHDTHWAQCLLTPTGSGGGHLMIGGHFHNSRPPARRRDCPVSITRSRETHRQRTSLVSGPVQRAFVTSIYTIEIVDLS